MEVAISMLPMLHRMTTHTCAYGKHLLELVDHKKQSKTKDMKLGDSASTNMLERDRRRLDVKHTHVQTCIYTYIYKHIYVYTQRITKCMRFYSSLLLSKFLHEEITF